MSDELFMELLENLRNLQAFSQKLTHKERWTFLYTACVMADSMDGQGRDSEDEWAANL